MGGRPAAGRALARAALGALAAGLAIWGGASPALFVGAAALLGGLLGWLLDRRLYRPLQLLHERIARGEPAARGASGSPPVDLLAAAVDRAHGELGRRIEETESRRRHLWEILESMSEGVLVADGEQKVELSNPAFRALLAARPAEPGQPVPELSRSPALASFLQRIATGSKLETQRIESEAGRTLELRGRPLAGGRSVDVRPLRRRGGCGRTVARRWTRYCSGAH